MRAGCEHQPMARPATILLCMLLLAGCGGGGDDDRPDRLTLTTPKTDGREPEAAPGGSGGGGSAGDRKTGPVTAAEEAVIRGWADALRRGDVERAVGYWRTPAIAANGNQPFKLLTRRAVRQFNDGLTCGARLESVERDQNYLLATFRLTERRGSAGSCGPGVGNRARTLFLLRDGKIVQWIRASDPPGGADGPDASTS
jgi:hypothetical protein